MVSPDTSLVWSEGSAAAGYRLHWRLTTESEWSRSRYVGDLRQFTLQNIVIDNYFFGVSSVAQDGNESPVVFPGAAGRF